MLPSANHHETSQIPLTIPRRSNNEGKHASADFLAKYVSNQTIGNCRYPFTNSKASHFKFTSINSCNKHVSKELNGSNDGQILVSSANHHETSQIPLTIPQRSNNEGKDASTDFSTKYISSQAIAMLPATKRSRPVREIDVSCYNFSDTTSTITSNPVSHFLPFTNSKRNLDKQINNHTNATRTTISDQVSENWSCFGDISATNPKIKTNETDEDQENSSIRRINKIQIELELY